MTKNMKKILIGSIILLGIDQLIKYLIINYVGMNEVIPVINNFFNITFVKNYGAAYSILSGNRYFLIAVTFVFLIAIYFFYLKEEKKSKLELVTLTFLIGGILGNLVDRIIHGYVVDYLSFNIGTHYFPVFNCADTFIVLSVMVLLIIEIRGMKNEINSRK